MKGWQMRTLVIGGTGPTGPFVVNGLVAAGHSVTILHTGKHELDTLPPFDVVPHIHADPFDEASFCEALAGLNFDVTLVMYGRLRMIAKVMAGKTGRLISIGGVPVYAGFMESSHLFPKGMPFPTREDAPLVGDEGGPKVLAIRRTEETLYQYHPTATHIRYPGIYGASQPVPLQWPIVKRAMDRRKTLIVADGGLQLLTYIYAENAAHAVLLAVEKLDISAGERYNISDDRLFTVAQLVELVEAELDHKFELVSLPYDLAKAAWPMLAYHASEHRVVDASKIRYQLGYRDKIDPVEAMRSTIRWQATVLAKDSAEIDVRLQDPYDYAAEDKIADLYREFTKQCQAVEYIRSPGWTAGYYGPRQNPAGKAVGLKSA
jgi:nucleoside-diphosphate-sugar epimerase